MTTITDKELLKHKRLMSDFIYAMAIPRLLDIKGGSSKIEPDKALEAFRENQYYLLKKYGYLPTFEYYIDFDGNIIRRKKD